MHYSYLPGSCRWEIPKNAVKFINRTDHITKMTIVLIILGVVCAGVFSFFAIFKLQKKRIVYIVISSMVSVGVLIVFYLIIVLFQKFIINKIKTKNIAEFNELNWVAFSKVPKGLFTDSELNESFKTNDNINALFGDLALTTICSNRGLCLWDLKNLYNTIVLLVTNKLKDGSELAEFKDNWINKERMFRDKINSLSPLEQQTLFEKYNKVIGDNMGHIICSDLKATSKKISNYLFYNIIIFVLIIIIGSDVVFSIKTITTPRLGEKYKRIKILSLLVLAIIGGVVLYYTYREIMNMFDFINFATKIISQEIDLS
jgi:hypothetical protein